MEKVNYYRIICIFLTSAMERREAPAEKETIPSLLLVNEDVISPLRLVFDTTEKMVASLTSPQPQLSDRVQDRAGNEIRKNCTITEKVPSSAFTFKTLLRHFAKRVPKHVKLGCR